MPGFQCGTCGRIHDHVPRDLGFQRPASYFGVPERERKRRVHLTDDLCTIDRTEHFIRGVLYLPIRRTDEEFGWGVWARIGKADFDRYVCAWKTDTEESVPPFAGHLDGGVPPYPDTDGLHVTVTLRSGGQRPIFTVASELHPLGLDQRMGITEEKAHSFVAQYL